MSALVQAALVFVGLGGVCVWALGVLHRVIAGQHARAASRGPVAAGTASDEDRRSPVPGLVFAARFVPSQARSSEQERSR